MRYENVIVRYLDKEEFLNICIIGMIIEILAFGRYVQNAHAKKRVNVRSIAYY